MPQCKVNTNLAYIEVGFKAQQELPPSQVEPLLKSLLQQNFKVRTSKQFTQDLSITSTSCVLPPN